MNESDSPCSLPATTIVNPDFKDPAWVSIFNSALFYFHHKKSSDGLFLAWLNSDGECECVFHSTEAEKGDFRSPLRGTFSGFEFRRPQASTIERAIEQAEAALIALGATSVQIALIPFAHDEISATLQLNCLIKKNYSIKFAEINYTARIDDDPLIAKMERNNQKRWRKCFREGFTFQLESTMEGCEESYNVIAANRRMKGHPFSMTFQAVLDMKDMFPDKILFYSCRLAGAMVAAAISMQISTNVMYVYAWGDANGFAQHSPICYLAAGIYDEARVFGCKILDIGIATENGLPNEGLMRFKTTLGFRPSPKLILTKYLQ